MIDEHNDIIDCKYIIIYIKCVSRECVNYVVIKAKY